MGHTPLKAIDTMDALARAKALRGAHQAMALGNLVDAIVPGVRYALSDARRAMDVVYGRGGPLAAGARA